MSQSIARRGIGISVGVMAVAAGWALMAFGTDTHPQDAVNIGAAPPAQVRNVSVGRGGRAAGAVRGDPGLYPAVRSAAAVGSTPVTATTRRPA